MSVESKSVPVNLSKFTYEFGNKFIKHLIKEKLMSKENLEQIQNDVLPSFIAGIGQEYDLKGVTFDKKTNEVIKEKPFRRFYTVYKDKGLESVCDLMFEDLGLLYYLIQFVGFDTNYLVYSTNTYTPIPFKLKDKKEDSRLYKKDLTKLLTVAVEKNNKFLSKVSKYICEQNNGVDKKGLYVDPNLAIKKVKELTVESESKLKYKPKGKTIKINIELFYKYFKDDSKSYKLKNKVRLGLLMYLVFNMNEKNELDKFNLLNEKLLDEDLKRILIKKYSKLRGWENPLLSLLKDKFVYFDGDYIYINPNFAFFSMNKNHNFEKYRL